MSKDLYDILGISRNASDADIKKAYRKLSKKYHPDMQHGKSQDEIKEAEERFKDVSHAYEVLSDDNKRRNYDQFGDENGMGGGFPGGGGFDPFNMFNPFGGFSGFGSNRPQRPQVQPGRDIHMKIPVSIEDLFNGTKRSVKYTKKVRCSSCHGAGGSGQKTCPKCHGTGRFITKQMFGNGSISIREEQCPMCNGTGFYMEKKCDRCNGTGFEDKDVQLDIEFPAGIQDGDGTVYNDKGSESKSPSGPTGRFIAIADYKIDESKYKVEGLNVIEHVYIPYYKLLLGCTYTVNIPNGVSKTIKIESCIKEGTLKRLSGEGLPRPGNLGNNYPAKGDYYVCIHYLIPDKLTDIERQQLEVLNKN